MQQPREQQMQQLQPQYQQPIVQVFLSRPFYRLGSSVVGTVRVSWSKEAIPTIEQQQHEVEDNEQDNNDGLSLSLRDSLISLQLYAAGRCRIDPRWHQVANYVKLYGTCHPNLNPSIEQKVIQQQQQQQSSTTTTTTAAASSTSFTTASSSSTTSPLKRTSSLGTTSTDPSAANASTSSVVCFWATNVIELLDLPERQVGAWDDVQPKPIKLHGINPTSTFSTSSSSSQNQQKQHLTESTTTAVAHPGHIIERHAESHNHANFAATAASASNASNDVHNVIHQNSNHVHKSLQKRKKQQQQQLMFTFRIDIPDDIPPTFTASSCRYFYSIVVCATVQGQGPAAGGSSNNNSQILVHVPLSLVMSSSSTGTGLSTALIQEDPTRRRSHKERVKVGTCVAMAHSIGLPCHVSATDIEYRHAGPMTVVRRNNQQQHHQRRSQRQSRITNDAATSTSPLSSTVVNSIMPPTLRVADPNGNPCCILTVIGDTMKWIPGSRIILQLDFPNPHDSTRHRRRRQQRITGSRTNREDGHDDEVVHHDNISNNVEDDEHDDHAAPCCWIPCYQASACLSGEEVAVYEDGSKKRTRLYSLDTCHTSIDPYTTQRVCLTLFLPLDCPCTIQTDLVEVSVTCRVDITVGNSSTAVAASNNPVYTNLRLDLPCRVIQFDDDDNDEDSEDDDVYGDGRVNTMPLRDLLFGRDHNNNNYHPNGDASNGCFDKKDIAKDLKILSLRTLDFYHSCSK